jgi:hypothetical protein
LALLRVAVIHWVQAWRFPPDLDLPCAQFSLLVGVLSLNVKFQDAAVRGRMAPEPFMHFKKAASQPGAEETLEWRTDHH